jgi:hypothetical protein
VEFVCKRLNHSKQWFNPTTRQLFKLL